MPLFQANINNLHGAGYIRHGELHTDHVKHKSKSNLGAAVFAPTDPNNNTDPIIIAYRGSQNANDYQADARLTALGVIGKNYRSEAYAFYKSVRAQYPGREIVITGHSLGGHIAQYVGAKAVSTGGERNVSVQTFNSAAIDTTHQKAVERDPDMHRRFVNHRLDKDPVSHVQNRIGDVYTYPSKENTGDFEAHLLTTMRDQMPPEVLNQKVDPVRRASASLLSERIKGYQVSYDAKVRGINFGKSGADMARNNILNGGLETVLRTLKRGEDGSEPSRENLEKASDQLKGLQGQLPSGAVQEKKMLATFIKDIEIMNDTHNIKPDQGDNIALGSLPDTDSHSEAVMTEAEKKTEADDHQEWDIVEYDELSRSITSNNSSVSNNSVVSTDQNRTGLKQK
ncbi:MAG: DUF2974 domain-containing protein [Gammaproteobacteria bacterium]|nr:DUF2974 domain-containing protein [Gammaproteobacteria bacterium]